MNNKKRLGLFILILSITIAAVLAVTVSLFYRMLLGEEHRRLFEALQAQAALIEAVARFNAEYSSTDHPEGSFGATLSQILAAHRHFEGFGETGEFSIARLEGDALVYLLPERHGDGSVPPSQPLDASVDEAMRQALRGHSGTLIARDARNVEVLAAYVPIKTLHLGLVARLDLEEIRSPIIHAGIVALSVGGVLIVLGAFFFLGLTNPLFRQLIASENRLRAVVDTAVDGIISIDAKGTVHTFNPAAETLFGYAAEEVIGRNVNMLMPEPYRSGHDGYLERFGRTGEARIIGIGREVVGQRKDGTTFPMDLAVSEMRLGEGVFFTGIVRDLSERKRLEERLRAVVETAVDGIISIDAKGTVRTFNPAAVTLFGYEADEVIGCNVNMLMPEPYRSGHDGYLERFGRTGEARIIGIGREVVGRRKDGTTFPLYLAVSEMRLEEGVFFTGIVRDLSERNRLEEQVRISHSLRTIGKIAGSVAHHVNNRLQVVRSNAEILSGRMGDDERTQRALGRIEDTLAQIAPVMEQLLSFSGHQKADKAPLGLGDLVLETIPLVTALLSGEGSVKADVPENLLMVNGNRVLLKDAVLQLCMNAHEAMQDGGVVEVAVERAEPDEAFRARHAWAVSKDYAVVRVRDRGVGMTRERLETLFGDGEPGRVRPEVNGGGMGLSIAFGVAGSHGGGLVATSAPGEGTDVGLYLPVVSRETAE